MPDKGGPEPRDIKKFFLQEKPVDILLTLSRMEKSYAGELSSIVDTTYSHAVRVMNRMKEAGLVESERTGRKKEYRLTENGKRLADGLEQIFSTVEGMENSEPRIENRWQWEPIGAAP